MIEFIKEEQFWWTPKDGFLVLKEIFLEKGIVFLKNIRNPQNFQNYVKELGPIYYHPHADNFGLTHLSNNQSLINAEKDNLVGMTESALTPHTDRSGVSIPPKVLAFWIESQSLIGGTSTFVDGHKLIEDLSFYEPNIISILSTPNSVIFKSENGLQEGQILDISNNNYVIKFRFDQMIYFSPEISRIIPKLNDLIKKLTRFITIKSDEGYLINNHRWLHGRTHFIGERSCYRILLNDLKN